MKTGSKNINEITEKVVAVNSNIQNDEFIAPVNSKKTLRSNKDSDLRHRFLRENSKEMICMIDIDSKVIYLSPFIQKQTGWEIGSTVLKETIDFVHSGDLKIQTELFVKALLNPGVSFTGILRIKSNDDKYIWAESSFTNFFHINNVNAIVICFKDIDELKKANDNLKLGEEVFKIVVQNSLNLTTLTDENDQLIFISPQCKNVIGIDGEKFIGKAMPFNIHPDDVKICLEKWMNLKTNSEKILHHQYRLIDADGSIRWLSHSASRIDFDGQFKFLQSSIRNITEQKINDDIIIQKNIELQRTNNTMVNREIKMIELKREINDLLNRLGEDEKYVIME